MTLSVVVVPFPKVVVRTGIMLTRVENGQDGTCKLYNRLLSSVPTLAGSVQGSVGPAFLEINLARLRLIANVSTKLVVVPAGLASIPDMVDKTLTIVKLLHAYTAMGVAIHEKTPMVFCIVGFEPVKAQLLQCGKAG